mmetsp:Transcript_74741/g.118933  ORF Transcript_74741/g.118933 Transcript_74741/m.118933 type:complete len:280 (+) Transcript_74741:251-1090(+)
MRDMHFFAVSFGLKQLHFLDINHEEMPHILVIKLVLMFLSLVTILLVTIALLTTCFLLDQPTQIMQRQFAEPATMQSIRFDALQFLTVPHHQSSIDLLPQHRCQRTHFLLHFIVLQVSLLVVYKQQHANTVATKRPIGLMTHRINLHDINLAKLAKHCIDHWLKHAFHELVTRKDVSFLSRFRIQCHVEAQMSAFLLVFFLASKHDVTRRHILCFLQQSVDLFVVYIVLLLLLLLLVAGNEGVVDLNDIAAENDIVLTLGLHQRHYLALSSANANLLQG